VTGFIATAHKELPGCAMSPELQRDGMLRVLWSLDLSHRKTRPRHPAEQREGAASLSKGGFTARLREIAQTHPEAERFEIWSQDAIGIACST
jgi:hypothetical protein